MLAKQSWRIINGINPLVTSVMRARYFPGSSFLEAKLGNNHSYAWKSLMETKEVILQCCRRRIRNGQNTKIWQIPWLPCTINGFITSDMPELLNDAHVSCLVDETNRSWDEDVLKDIFNERDNKLIQQIPVPLRDREDSWYWCSDDKGKFTVKNCYRRLRGELECPERLFWKRLRGLKLPCKVINFLWCLICRVLPTADALTKKCVNIDPICSWCHLTVDDDMHILFGCCFPKEVWDKMRLSNLT